MNFKVGDRVSFLNDKGGGIISKIVDKEVVHVTIEDGFDIPVMAKELIKTGTAEIAESIRKAHENILKAQEAPVSDDIMPLYLSHNNPEQRPDGLYFCFVPQIQENPLSGSLDLFLINHTQYTSVFNLFLNYEGDYHGTEYGFIEPESRLQLGTIGRSEIEKWANALFQSVFFIEGKSRPLPPFSGLINFRPIRLYKEENFQWESLLRKKAFFVQVALLSEISAKPLIEEKISKESLRALEEKIKPAAHAGSSRDAVKKETFLDKHKIDDLIAEVDLHIGELVENFSNLDNNDLLNIQIEYFKKCMHEAEREKLNKIIFIHGIGNGKLKAEIHRLLQKTEGINHYDASFARYGLGATEVEFYRNK
jgi:hypothetical protein